MRRPGRGREPDRRHHPESGHTGHHGLHPRHGRGLPPGGGDGLCHRHRRRCPAQWDVPLPRERQHPALLHPHGAAVRRGDVSSQFVTGSLLALPLLPEDSTLRVLPPVESRPYIDITLDIMASFGVTVMERERNFFYIPGGQRYGSRCAAVEGDWSNAAFLLALGGGVRVSGLRPDSLQGDRVCREMLRRLERPGAVLDLSACPDLGPVLFAAAAQRCGAVFTGTRRLRIKESDRAAAMAQELAKFGAQVTVEEDRVTVLPCPLHAPNEELEGHNDHRIVMAMAVLCASLGGTIRGAEAVNKSYPDFFRTLWALGLRMDVRP